MPAVKRSSYWADFPSGRNSVTRVVGRRDIRSASRRSSWKSKLNMLLGAREKPVADEFNWNAWGGWVQRRTLDGLVYYYEPDSGRVSWEKPEELKTDQEILEDQAEWVWVPHPKNVWQPAKVISKESNGAVIVNTMNNEVHKVPHIRVMKGKLTGGISQKVPLWPLKRHYLDAIEPDLVAIEALDEGLVMHVLRCRYENDDIYTWVGGSRTVLVSINPFKYIEKLYSDEAVRLSKQGGPHIYAIADDSLESLLYENKSQSILVSGESGAGKTQVTRQCLDFLARVTNEGSKRKSMPVSFSMTTNGDEHKVEQKVLVANPVLESFGNAKTVRNNNSSRFGKWIGVYIDRKNKIITGAKITSFLLETTRVTSQAPTERSYHIFYQLLQSPEIVEKYNLTGDAADYGYLNRSGCTLVDSIDDQDDFSKVLTALDQLDFEDEEIEWLFRTTASILHVGNISFDEVSLPNGKSGCSISSPGAQQGLENASELLDIVLDDLKKVLTLRSITVRGEVSEIPLSVAKAEQARDSLAKAVYGKLFDWLVERINSSFGETSGKFIGILDIFGFEIFEHNSFEQLCINYCNEKLQHRFNTNTFNDEEDLYEIEKIRYKHTDFQDNTPILELLDCKPQGILNLLDDECLVPNGTDQKLLQRLEAVHSDNHYFQSGSKNKNKAIKRQESDPLSFSIKHFAGSVTYDARGFMSKNIDNLFQDLYDICSESDDSLTQDLFPALQRDERVKIVTQGFKFRSQLNELMSILDKTESRYIRCVKPNAAQVPNDFEGRKCLEQLRASGVFEAIAIRKNGFAFRMYHDEFITKYRCINPNHTYVSKPEDEKSFCQEIIDMCPHKLPGIQIGEMRVMYRVKEHKMLNLLRDISLSKVIPVIQKVWKGALARMFFKALNQAESKLVDAIAQGSDISRLETVIDDVPDTLGSIGNLFRLNPPSLSKAKSLHAGLEQWETLEGEMEDFEGFHTLDDLSPAQIVSVRDLVRRATDLRESYPMTDDQKSIYDHLKELLVESPPKVDIEERAQEAMLTMDQKMLEQVSEEASQWASPMDLVVNKVNEIVEQLDDLRELISRAIENVDRSLLQQVLATAEESNFLEPRLDEVRRLLSLESREFLESELQAAVKWKDRKRIISRELLKREYDLCSNFDKYQNFFDNDRIRGISNNKNCLVKLKTSKPEPKIQLGFTTQKLKTSILLIRDPELTKRAVAIFEDIKIHMGDIKKQIVDIQPGFKVLKAGYTTFELRDEIFTQLVMQLTGNPSLLSIKKGVDLLCMCLAVFPPSDEPFENYLTVWTKLHLPPDFYNVVVANLHDHRFQGDCEPYYKAIRRLFVHRRSLVILQELSENGGIQASTNEDDELAGYDFNDEASRQTLEACRERFISFENGSRWSRRCAWDEDPWQSKKVVLKNILLDGSLAPSDLPLVHKEISYCTATSDDTTVSSSEDEPTTILHRKESKKYTRKNKLIRKVKYAKTQSEAKLHDVSVYAKSKAEKQAERFQKLKGIRFNHKPNDDEDVISNEHHDSSMSGTLKKLKKFKSKASERIHDVTASLAKSLKKEESPADEDDSKKTVE